MRYRIEVESIYAAEHPAGALVYEPVPESCTSRETRVYDVEAEGDETAVRRFAEHVLADRFAQRVHIGEAPALEGYRYFLDVAYRPGVLDLEKEYLLRYYRSLEAPGFDLRDLTIRRRVYIFGADEALPPETLRKDLVNPAVQIAELVSA